MGPEGAWAGDPQLAPQGGAEAQGGFWLGLAPVHRTLCSLGACRSFTSGCRGTAALMSHSRGCCCFLARAFLNHVQHSVGF